MAQLKGSCLIALAGLEYITTYRNHLYLYQFSFIVCLPFVLARFLVLFIWGEVPVSTRHREIKHAVSSPTINHGSELSLMAGTTTWIPDGDGTDSMCPLLENPQPDCYCLKLTSLNIPRAVHFCLRDFRDCPIYQRFMEIDDF